MPTASGSGGGKPELLYLCHRVPYPPDKGDKIRSYWWLRALTKEYRVHLVAFVDDAADLQYQGYLDTICETCRLVVLDRRIASLRALAGLVAGEPLTLGFYRDQRIGRWLERLAGSAAIGTVLVYSSAMAQYVERGPWVLARRVIDFVDVDSDKWRQYAQRRRGLARRLYAREAERLEQYEVTVTEDFDQAIFVSGAELEFFQSRCKVGGQRIEAVSNGVDAEYFRPDPGFSPPFAAGGPVIVFTGFMSYWANVDAVRWFANDIWPDVLKACPTARFFIVGAQPTKDVLALAGEHVVVTGRVPDVRPYLQFATVVVAPLRVARGIQCKVLEGMAMGKVLVVTDKALEGIDADPGRDLLVANDEKTFAGLVAGVLIGGFGDMGAAARRKVLTSHSWDRHCEDLLRLVAGR